MHQRVHVNKQGRVCSMPDPPGRAVRVHARVSRTRDTTRGAEREPREGSGGEAHRHRAPCSTVWMGQCPPLCSRPGVEHDDRLFLR